LKSDLYERARDLHVEYARTTATRAHPRVR
jgi:hypothetical protein